MRAGGRRAAAGARTGSRHAAPRDGNQPVARALHQPATRRQAAPPAGRPPRRRRLRTHEKRRRCSPARREADRATGEDWSRARHIVHQEAQSGGLSPSSASASAALWNHATTPCLTGVSDALLLARGAGFPRRVCGGGGGGTEAGGEAGSAGRALRLSAEPTMGKVRARRCMFVPTQPCALPQVYGAAVARWHTPLAQSDSPPQSQPRAAGCCPSGGACRRGKRLRDRPPERDRATHRVLARCGSSTGVGWGANSVLPPSAAGIRRR